MNTIYLNFAFVSYLILYFCSVNSIFLHTVKQRFIFLLSLFILISCAEKKTPPQQTFLALGDSYTVGIGVDQSESWPFQLIKKLAAESIIIAPPRVIAENGWTTIDLKKAIDEAALDFPYDWVSLLIGVNNQYDGKSIAAFQNEFEQLLSQAILFAGSKKENVFVISIPDWGKTPFAKERDREQIALEIDNFNQVIYEQCIRVGVAFIDITPLSRTIDTHPAFIAEDGLHPSGQQYKAWIDEIVPFFINQKNE